MYHIDSWMSLYLFVCFFFFLFFFFSSRRRHTRWPRDWSSDVCSSDLIDSRPTRGAPRWPTSSEGARSFSRSEEHTSELQSRGHLVCRLLLEKKKKRKT